MNVFHRKVRVARMDGTPESGFAPGAIKSVDEVPVMRNFDPRLPPVGVAKIYAEADAVYAVLALRPGVQCSGLYPALGVRSAERVDYVNGHVFDSVDLLCVSLNDQPNLDPLIEPLD